MDYVQLRRMFPSNGASVPVIGPYICRMADNQRFTVVRWEPKHGVSIHLMAAISCIARTCLTHFRFNS